MNSAKNWLIVLLALTALGGAFLAWRQHGELAALRATAMPRDERADFQKRVWDLERENRELKQQLTTSRESTAAGLALAPGSRQQRGDSGRTARRDPDQQLAAMSDLFAKPDVQALYATQQRGEIEARYATVFRSLNLPPDQLARLASLLTERRTALLDIAAVARDQGVDLRSNAPGLQQLVATTQEQINQSIRGVIGDTGFAQLTAFEQTAPQRNTVSELQQRLSYTGTPLTTAQSDQLVQILAANPAPRPATTTPPTTAPGALPTGQPDGAGLRMLGGPTASTATITPAAVAQSQSVLSPPQVSALQQLQQQQQAQQQLRQLVTETLGSGQPAARGTGGKK